MKALKFYKELKESEPSTSSRENEEAARKYPEKLAKIIKDGEYCAHQVFNADETGLFWKKMPTRTYIAKVRKKTASGFKAAKDRVALLLCSKCIWRSNVKTAACKSIFKTTCIKRKRLKYHIGWLLTTAIFTEWFNKCFVPEVENYMNEMGLEFKILLILDNAPGNRWEGFDDFGEHDIEELLVDEALNDDDILESMVDITKDLETVDSEPEEDVTPLDEKLLREGLQLSVPEEALPCRSDDVILSSSDESDLAPIHKRGWVFGGLLTPAFAVQRYTAPSTGVMSFQEPFFINRTILAHIQQGFHRTVSSTFPPFPGLLHPQICHRLSISRIIKDGYWDSLRISSN
ncbi:tigger transposable element-derived protein 1 [Trichonephila clavipes]|nr:tigger transposable element-derived protein 1 [Trichonephila clavipes]